MSASCLYDAAMIFNNKKNDSINFHRTPHFKGQNSNKLYAVSFMSYLPYILIFVIFSGNETENSAAA